MESTVPDLQAAGDLIGINKSMTTGKIRTLNQTLIPSTVSHGVPAGHAGLRRDPPGGDGTRGLVHTGYDATRPAETAHAVMPRTATAQPGHTPAEIQPAIHTREEIQPAILSLQIRDGRVPAPAAIGGIGLGSDIATREVTRRERHRRCEGGSADNGDW